MSPAPPDDAALDRLRRAYPWPPQRPAVRTIDWSLDAGGKHLIIDRIVNGPVRVLVEIGVFLGGSVKTWLRASPDLTVVAVDPWGLPDVPEYARQTGKPAWAVEQLRREEGFYETFLANLWEDRHRVIPLRGSAPEALYEIHRFGVQPDLVFLDADKSGREIEVCHELFPRAILSGDDWWWGTDRFWNPDDGYPIRRPVLDFCKRHDLFLKTARHTWLIEDRPPTLRYRMTRFTYYLKGARRRSYALMRAALRHRFWCD